MKIKDFIKNNKNLLNVSIGLNRGLILDLSNGYKVAEIDEKIFFIHMDKFEDEDIIFPLKEIDIYKLNELILNHKYEFILPV